MRFATCHPDRKHHCNDLCVECYNKKSHQRRMLDPKFRANNVKRSRKWALDNPEKAYRLDSNKHLIKKYGINLEQYEILLHSQEEKCKICKKPEVIITKKRVSRLAVDHCHKTNKIRGLLCFKCNTLIAHLEVNPGLLEEIRKYLDIK